MMSAKPTKEELNKPLAEPLLGPSDRPEKSVALRNFCMGLLYVTVWITLSATVILYNKYILAYCGVPPILLTGWHMAFCSVLAWICVKAGWVAPAADMTAAKYCQTIVPIGICFAGTLWLGNSAYVYLSVSFIQMLKALMPVAVFGVGCCLKTETFGWATFTNMLVVTAGVMIASYGELNFVVIGVLLQLTAVVTESTRLTLVQILLQRRGMNLNPVTTMYYVAPVSGAFLLIPFAFLEAPLLWSGAVTISVSPAIMLSNAAAAFALNVSVFLLIGQTSALTMNVAGVVKDWLLIALSALIFGSEVTQLNIFGYSIAFGGVCVYNYRKARAMAKPAASASGLNGASEKVYSVSASAAQGEAVTKSQGRIGAISRSASATRTVSDE